MTSFQDERFKRAGLTPKEIKRIQAFDRVEENRRSFEESRRRMASADVNKARMKYRYIAWRTKKRQRKNFIYDVGSSYRRRHFRTITQVEFFPDFSSRLANINGAAKAFLEKSHPGVFLGLHNIERRFQIILFRRMRGTATKKFSLFYRGLSKRLHPLDKCMRHVWSYFDIARSELFYQKHFNKSYVGFRKSNVGVWRDKWILSIFYELVEKFYISHYSTWNMTISLDPSLVSFFNELASLPFIVYLVPFIVVNVIFWFSFSLIIWYRAWQDHSAARYIFKSFIKRHKKD